MNLSNFIETADEVENLLMDARFFSKRVQDIRLVDDIAARYVEHGMAAEVTEKDVRRMKDVAGWP